MNWQPGNTLAEIEKQVILQAFRYCGQNKTRTAQMLDIAIRTLDNKLEQYGAGKEVTPQPDTNRRIGPDTSGGLHLEPVKVDAQKQSVPVRERQEVQKMPPKRTA